MRGLLTLFIFISVIFFPWPLAAVLTLCSSLSIPLLPLAAGIFADTLYYSPSTNVLVLGTPHMPLFALCGAIATSAAIFVRSRLKTSIINR